MTDKPDNNTEDNTSGFCKSVPTESGAIQSKKPVVIDPSSPKAGKGGVIPPAPAWKPGQSGNPKGRQTAGASVKEWYNQMKEWPRSKIERVITDDNAPINKRTAARDWLAADSDRQKPDSSVDRIIEHTEGKAAQQIKHDHTGMAGLGIVVRVEGMATPELPPAPGEPKQIPNKSESDG